jgi:hypothetical protein
LVHRSHRTRGPALRSAALRSTTMIYGRMTANRHDDAARQTNGHRLGFPGPPQSQTWRPGLTSVELHCASSEHLLETNWTI